MGVTQGEGKGIGLVLRRHFREGEQEPHHVLDLGLLRAPGADYGELDRFGTVLVDLHVSLEPGTEHRPPSLTELEGRGYVASKDELLHRHLVGPVLLHHLGDAIEEQAQPLGPRQVADPNTAAGNADAVRTVGVDHPESGSAGARIYP